MKTIIIRGDAYPAIEAARLENGMIYFDGSEITDVRVSGKTVRFTLTFGSIRVARTVRTTSWIALSEEQVAVFI
jgi:hypothetical protein